MKKDFPILDAILGTLRALYTVRLFDASEHILGVAYAMEEGRRVARDIAGSDPERMSAPRIVEYLTQELPPHPRAVLGVERHKGKVVQLTYKGCSTVDTTLFLIGKGITYNTGGVDVKVGGVMAGMHRDKSGAPAIAGFFKTLSLLKQKGLLVHGVMALVRNSIGSDGYVADEIITSRAGRRIRVGNTDAKGRLAKYAVNPFLFTFATLTGHAIRAYSCYTAIMDNGIARRLDVTNGLQRAGNQISTIRREDYEAVKGRSEHED
eukprot:TsM_000644800 transcript=TsM_000644800 gene=TsM_000644800